jgi:hypothetical protein
MGKYIGVSCLALNKRPKKMPNIIDIYPQCDKPYWLIVGAICKCWGEGEDLFRIDMVGKNAAILYTLNGKTHGWESFTKLHRTGIE